MGSLVTRRTCGPGRQLLPTSPMSCSSWQNGASTHLLCAALILCLLFLIVDFWIWIDHPHLGDRDSTPGLSTPLNALHNYYVMFQANVPNSLLEPWVLPTVYRDG